MKARAILLVPVALLLAVTAVRAMTFIAPASHPLRALQSLFPGHPRALTDQAMTDIGSAAARGGTVSDEAKDAIARVAAKAPLAPEPFLVDGTIATMGGDRSHAVAAFLAARSRDPRSSAARYLLADHYLKAGQIVPGLVEMAALARLSEKASEPLAPALAAYAKDPAAAPALRRFFQGSPEVGGRTLALLAADPANTDLILRLAPQPRPGAKPTDWQIRMINALVEAGELARAETIWTRFSGVAARGLLFNSRFQALPAPPPFNWEYASTSGGVAEPSGAGGLAVIYYGREPANLALQLLRLAPGSYQLAMRIEKTGSARGLAWTLACTTTADKPFATLALETQRAGRISGAITVPANCPAQWLVLRGQPGDVAETAQLTIFDLDLRRAGRR